MRMNTFRVHLWVTWSLVIVVSVTLILISTWLSEKSGHLSRDPVAHHQDVHINMDRRDMNVRLFCQQIWSSHKHVNVNNVATSNTKSSCSCGNDSFTIANQPVLPWQRKAYELWENEYRETEEPIVFCPALSPFGYIGGGITVEPGKYANIRGLYIHPTALTCFHGNYDSDTVLLTITCSRGVGTMFVSSSLQYSKFLFISGNNTNQLLVITSFHGNHELINSTNEFNVLLNNIFYQNVYYDIFRRDLIRITLKNITVEINVLIRRQPLPRLYDVRDNKDISSMVTIVTKTFERYKAVNNLIRSIRVYYPNITIVIADDSEFPKHIHGQKIKQFVMPFAEGWFAGRNLALSQVRTKYFLWVDDDFEFTDGTNLELFVEKLDDKNEKLDIVAGIFEKSHGQISVDSYFQIFDISKSENFGSCLVRKRGAHRKLSYKKFPQCYMTDVVLNFFMGKTQSVRKIGFDPEFQRVAHSEFFIDALGELRIAVCLDVSIKHKPVKTSKYNLYRSRDIDPQDKYRNIQHVLFKNNLQCYKLY
ncbi:beta-1,4 N-acetylgalactosaminyltransferase 1-like [Saccoglossus kowalevskii]